jgi:hypothetical protein
MANQEEAFNFTGCPVHYLAIVVTKRPFGNHFLRWRADQLHLLRQYTGLAQSDVGEYGYW